MMIVAAIRNGAASRRNKPQVLRITNAKAMAPRAGLRWTTRTVPKPSAPSEKRMNRTEPTASGIGLPNVEYSHTPNPATAAIRKATPPGTKRPRGRGSSIRNPTTASTAASAICAPESWSGVRELSRIKGSCSFSQAVADGISPEAFASRVNRQNHRNYAIPAGFDILSCVCQSGCGQLAPRAESGPPLSAAGRNQWPWLSASVSVVALPMRRSTARVEYGWDLSPRPSSCQTH